MEIEISARHFEMTDHLRDAVIDGISHIHNYGLHALRATVVLDINHNDCIIKASIVGGMVSVEAHHESDDMYSSIIIVADRLERQLQKRSAQLANR
jgi:putative sigma-54 modulation protein